jgi:hypothetical protein
MTASTWDFRSFFGVLEMAGSSCRNCGGQVQSDMQSPENIAQLYMGLDQNRVSQNVNTLDTSPLQSGGQGNHVVMECDLAGSEDEDSEQKSRWMRLMCQAQDDELLQAMELLDDKETIDKDENSKVLTKEVVAAIGVARELDPQLKVFEKKNKKFKPDSWGPVLVDRQRRCKNDGVSMMQKAVALKKRKNLEPLKGNSFAALQFESIDSLTVDLNLQLGSSKFESKKIIDTLMEKEKQCRERFVEDNPEVNLPMNLDIACSQPEELLDNTQRGTPEPSLKEGHSSPMWTEVVREGAKLEVRILKLWTMIGAF